MAKAKGKTKAGRVAQDLTTAQQVQLPEAARLRSQPTLLQDLWQQYKGKMGVATAPQRVHWSAGACRAKEETVVSA
eukprot:5003002-Amphidinium_carterae.1